MVSGVTGVNQVCGLFGISKSTYYHVSVPGENFEQKYLFVKNFLEELIAKDSNYGVRRMKQALLDEYKLVIGRDVLGKLLKLWKLELKRKTKRSQPSMIQKLLIWLGGKTNILAKTKINRPLQAISSDITRLYYNQGESYCYLCVHKDVYGQIVYGFQVSQNMEVSIVLQSFRQSIKSILKLNPLRFKTSSPKLIAHQDQGSQYTSYKYVEEVLAAGCRLSYSRKGTPTDNPGQESFFGRFKDEWGGEILELEMFKEVAVFVKDKIWYYNEVRLHTSTGLKSPKAFTKISLISQPNRFD